jgi:hypothetical protein
VICHSLTNPCGSTWQDFHPTATSAFSLPSLLPTEYVFVSASLTIAHPRGPPSVG